jgi:Coenzyme PQQ synthesis protein D (PqqD)
MSVQTRARLSPTEDVLIRKVGDELVLLHMGTEIYFGLDPVGVAMWEAICESGTIAGAHEALVPQYDVDATQLLSDLQELTDQLVDRGLLTIRSD